MSVTTETQTETSVTQDIIRLLEQALVTDEAPPRPPHIDPLRWEKDEYDYDLPGYDPDEPTGDEPYYPDEGDEETINEVKTPVTEVDAPVEVADVPPPRPAHPMMVSVMQENAKKALTAVYRFIDKYPSLPILQNVLLETEDSRLKISASDLESSITYWIGAKVEVPGATTVDARTFKDLVTSLTPERLDFRCDDTQLHIRCGVQTLAMPFTGHGEYPVIRHSDGYTGVHLEVASLLRMLDSTIKCVAIEQNRPILTGIYMALERGKLVLAGADGYRLGVERLDVEDARGDKRDAVIPAAALRKLMPLLRSHKKHEITIQLVERKDKTPQVSFFLPNIVVTTETLEGRFPDYMTMVPRSGATQVVLYAADTKVALQRAKIFAKHNANSCYVDIKPALNPGEPAEVRIGANCPEYGNTEAMMDATATGPPVSFSVHYKYLLEAIDAYRKVSDRIVIDTNGPEHAAVIRPEHRPLPNLADAPSIAVVMPMSK